MLIYNKTLNILFTPISTMAGQEVFVDASLLFIKMLQQHSRVRFFI